MRELVSTFATTLAGGAVFFMLAMPAGAQKLDVDVDLGGIDADLGVSIGDGVDAGADASIGGSRGINADVNASVGGADGIDADATASIGGSRGVNADGDATVGGDSGIDADATTSIGGDDGATADVGLGASGVAGIGGTNGGLDLGIRELLDPDGLGIGEDGAIGGSPSVPGGGLANTDDDDEAETEGPETTAPPVVARMDDGERVRYKRRCEEVTSNPAAYDAELVSLCGMIGASN